MEIQTDDRPLGQSTADSHAQTIPGAADWIFLQPSILDQMHDSIIVTDLNGIVTGCNRAAFQVYGYTAEELIGKSVMLLYPEEDRHLLQDAVIPAVMSTGSYHGEQRNQTQSGQSIYVHLSISQLRDGDGKPAGMVGFSVDVTRQKLAELAIKHHEAVERQLHVEGSQNELLRLRFLAESIPQLLWTANEAGLCDFISQSCAKFLGVEPGDCYGQGWTRFIHPEDLDRSNTVWKEAVEQRHTFVVEYRLRRHDGEYLWFLHRAVPRFSDAGAPLEWIGTSTDIELQKRSEKAIRQTEKLAAVGRLASSISHEINNPLTAVTNLLYLLASQTELTKTAQEYVRTAQDELARISEITTQTLRFHKQSTFATPTRLAEVLDSVLSFYRQRMVAGGLTVRREYEKTEQLTCLAGDIRQALSNLIGNAIDASSDGGRLRIRLRPSVDWKNRRQRGVRITIADTGNGIPRETIHRVFEPFYTTKGITGTGLGLWITKDLISKHDGTISLRSSTEANRHGTVVSLLLPFEPKPVH